MNGQELKRELDVTAALDPLTMSAHDRHLWALRLAVICERLANLARERANDLESAYWTQAEQAMYARRPRIGLRARSTAPLTADERRRARINAGTMLGGDVRFKDACSDNEMYNRWSMMYSQLALAVQQVEVSLR